LTYNRWKTDISGEISAEEARQISLLYLRLMFVDLQKELEDSFTWPYSPDGPYSTISTYNRLWEGTQRFVAADCIWKSRTPLKCQIFMWLAVKHIIWKSDRRAEHGLREQVDTCHFFLQESESTKPILSNVSMPDRSGRNA
jgi:hypothetical protein